jgi:glutamate-1-semialdehyde aminotransferase
MRALTDEVYEHLDSLGSRLGMKLGPVFEYAGIPNQVHAVGSVVNVYLTDTPARDYRSFRTHDAALFERISLAVHLKGYSLGHPPMAMMLSSPMTNEHINGLVQAFGEALAEED